MLSSLPSALAVVAGVAEGLQVLQVERRPAPIDRDGYQKSFDKDQTKTTTNLQGLKSAENTAFEISLIISLRTAEHDVQL